MLFACACRIFQLKVINDWTPSGIINSKAKKSLRLQSYTHLWEYTPLNIIGLLS